MRMASDESLALTFAKLRPVCVRVTEEQTVENLRQLLAVLDAVDLLALEELQEYALFPLVIILKQPRESRAENVFIQTVACINKVINSVDKISELPIFIDLFSSLCCLISSRDADIGVAPVCEELKLETVQSLGGLVRKLPLNLLGRVYRASFLPCLGHAVTLLLFLAQHESMRSLRIAAVNCLMDLMLVERDTTEELMVNCGNIFASFLPGIATGLFKVITGDVKQGHEVTCAAVRGWSSAVTLVLGDVYLAGDAATSEGLILKNGNEDSRNLSVSRSPDWVKTTTEKLKVLIDRLILVANHSHWKVRLAMSKFANELLTKCITSLSCCVVPLLDVLVRGSSDEFPEVAALSDPLLVEFQERQVANGSQSLIELLEENVFNLATQLPRKVMDPNDAKKLSSLRLLCGYVMLLGHRIDSLLASDVHLKRLSQALMQVLEFESSSLIGIQDQSSETSLGRYDSSHRHHYQFKHFSAIEVEVEVTKVCRLLGQYGNLYLLIDHFMDLFGQSVHYRKQAAFCISEILTGAALGPQKDLFQRYSESEVEVLIKSVLDEFLELEHWQLPLASCSIKGTSIQQHLHLRYSKPVSSLDTLNSNILQTCLLLDGIGSCARVTGSRFHVHLIDVLYPVLEKVGSDNMRVSQQAVLCVQEIAKACGCCDVRELIRSAMDYLLNSVMLHWRHLQSNPQVLDVLRVLFQYSNKDILLLLSNTIHQMFELLDLHYDEFGEQFLRVFHALVTSVANWFCPSNDGNAASVLNLVSPDANSTRQRFCKTTEDVCRFFEDYHRQKKILENMDKDDDDDDDDVNLESSASKTATAEKESSKAETNAEDEAKAEEMPCHVRILKEVFERCLHCLIRPEPKVRLLALDIIGQSCLVLKPYQDELLPLVHRVWTPFVQRFSDTEQVVVMKAFDTLRLMAVAAQDFLRRRIMNDIVPQAITSLNRLSELSLKAGPAYKYSMSCKLQLCILENLGYFCQHADIKGHQLTSLLHAYLSYLSARQPPSLQQASVKAFKCFIGIDPDSVWLLLNDVHCPTVLQPPDDSLPHIKMAGNVERDEFTDNVMELIKLL